MDQELNLEVKRIWLSAIQIFFHSEQFFVVFRIKKIRSKLEHHPLHPYILSYKLALHAILDQKLRYI